MYINVTVKGRRSVSISMCLRLLFPAFLLTVWVLNFRFQSGLLSAYRDTDATVSAGSSVAPIEIPMLLSVLVLLCPAVAAWAAPVPFSGGRHELVLKLHQLLVLQLVIGLQLVLVLTTGTVLSDRGLLCSQTDGMRLVLALVLAVLLVLTICAARCVRRQTVCGWCWRWCWLCCWCCLVTTCLAQSAGTWGQPAVDRCSPARSTTTSANSRISTPKSAGQGTATAAQLHSWIRSTSSVGLYLLLVYSHHD